MHLKNANHSKLYNDTKTGIICMQTQQLKFSVTKTAI